MRGDFRDEASRFSDLDSAVLRRIDRDVKRVAKDSPERMREVLRRVDDRCVSLEMTLSDPSFQDASDDDLAPLVARLKRHQDRAEWVRYLCHLHGLDIGG